MDTKSNKFKLDFMPIGQDIKQAREARDVTREQLSEIIDYVPRHIQAPKCSTFLLTGTYLRTGMT